MILGILQARANSSRLPNKILLKIKEKTILEYELERILNSKKINKIIVATTTNKKDDEIVKICQKMGVECYRGLENDVLHRFKMASDTTDAKTIVRLNSDCPLLDPLLIDDAIRLFLTNEYDYVSTLFPKTGSYPDGMSVEVFSKKILDKIFSESKRPSEREHVTPSIWNNPDKFKIKRMENKQNLSKYRFCLDYEEDFQLIKNVIENLWSNKPNFKLDELIEWMEKNPDMFKINSQIKIDEGWKRSIQKDKLEGFNQL